MDTVSLLAQIEQLKKENEVLQARLNRFEIHNLRLVKRALYNLGFALPESDEELMKEWPSFLKFMVRRVANLNEINI